MHRLPLPDELPYRFQPPRLSPFWVRTTSRFRRRMLAGPEHRILEIGISGADHLDSLSAGDGVLLAPNHCCRADGLLMLEVAERLGRPACAMAAYQIFAGNAGMRRWLFPRLGIFPVDREGSDRAAYKAAVDVLAVGRHPLLLFPEGEVYYTADRLTPLRDGASSIAVAAARRLADEGRTAWIVPIGIKYRFPDGFDPTPAFREKLDILEARLTWRPAPERPIVERIYRFAEALLSLKELEHLGKVGEGSLPRRITALASSILGAIEARRLARPASGDPIPERVKVLRRACLDALTRRDPRPEPAEIRRLRRDLDDLFLVVQAYSYPGDYVAEHPTLERIAETLMKLDEDLLVNEGGFACPPGPRRAVVRIGEPIDVGALLGSATRPREATAALTAALEHGIQAELDALGPGRLIESAAVRDRVRGAPA